MSRFSFATGAVEHSRFWGVLVGALLLASLVRAAPLGDVNLDGAVDVADALLLERHLAQQTTLSIPQQLAADVAPWVGGVPQSDDALNLGDLIVLLRHIRGEIGLPMVPAVPVLDPILSPIDLDQNPIEVTGTASEGDLITLYRIKKGTTNLAEAEVLTTTAQTGGFFAFLGVVLEDEESELFATATAGGVRSGPSAVETVTITLELVWGEGTTPSISSDTWWVAPTNGDPYVITGVLTVTSELTILPGVRVEFATGPSGDKGRIWVNASSGVLHIEGEAGKEIVLTSASATPQAGDWNEIRMESGAEAVIRHAIIQYAVRGVVAWNSGTNLTVEDCTISNFSASGTAYGIGVRFNAAAGIHRNLIYNGDWDPVAELCLGGTGFQAGTGIFLEQDSQAVTIDQNRIACLEKGLHVLGAAPTVTANTIDQNQSAIFLDHKSTYPQTVPLINGQNRIIDNVVEGIRITSSGAFASYPDPTINDNSIYGNGVNVTADERTAVPPGKIMDMDSNYWGTTDSDQIAAGIEDALDHEPDSQAALDKLPVIDFVPFRDLPPEDPGSTLIRGTHLIGDIDPSLPLEAGATYKLFRTVTVPDAELVAVPEGVTFEMERLGALLVQGELQLNDQGGAPVTFTSMEPVPAPGDWKSIQVNSGTLTLENAVIEYARQAIDASQSTVTVRGTHIHSIRDPDDDFDTIGIRIAQGTLNEIVDSQIEGDCADPVGRGIQLDAVGGAGAKRVARNEITCFAKGIWILGGADGIDIDNNTIAGNGDGIHYRGIQQPGAVSENEFSGNTINLRLTNYTASQTPTVLDFTRNYWGVTTAPEIYGTFDLSALDSPRGAAIDFSDFLLETPDGMGTTPSSGTTHLSEILINVSRSLADVSFRPAQSESVDVEFELLAPADVTLHICSDFRAFCLGQSATKTIQTGTLGIGVHTVTWNGDDEAGNFVPEGAYTFALVATDSVVPAISSQFDSPFNGVGTEGFLCFTGACANNVNSSSDEINAAQNEFYHVDFDLNDPLDDTELQWVFLEVRPDSQAPSGPWEKVVGDTYLPRGSGHRLSWDGRLTNGSFVTEPFDARFHGGFFRWGANYFIVRDTIPRPVAPTGSPVLEVRSSPFLAYQSYDQVVEIVFGLSRAADLRVTVLPPGIDDPSDPSAIELVPVATGNPLEYRAVWDGFEAMDPNLALRSEEGLFTFAIEASDPADPTLKSLYRGVIQLRN